MTITPADLTALALAGSPALTPGGTAVIAAVQTVDATTLRRTTRLWTFRPGARATALTEAGPGNDTLPRVAPGGALVAYLSDRDGPRAARLVTPGGTPVPLEGPDAPVTEIAWLDDRRLLALADRPTTASDGAPVLVDRLRYKSDGGPGPLEPTGELWLLAPGAPPRLLHAGGDRLRCLTVHDGHAYCTVRARHSDALHPATEVRRLGPDGGPGDLVWRSPTPVSALAVTTSGRVLALAAGAPGHSAAAPRVRLADEGRPAFPGADLECERALLSDCRARTAPALLRAAGEEAVFAVTTGTEVALFAGRPDTTPRRPTPPGRAVADFDADAGGRIAACLEPAAEPVEVHLDGWRVSALNTAWTRERRPVAPEEITVTSADGLGVPGLLYRAPRGDGALLIRVHGGPHLAFGNSFDLETQTQLAAGYHVLMPSVRGTAGHGSAFRALSVGQWGRGDHDDLTAFADWAVASGIADPGRLYLAGGSYGGYLVNWALTRTGRYRAAVSERSVSNLLPKYGTSDNGFTVNRHEFGGLDVLDPGGAAELWDRSPLAHAAAVTTPVLLMHGERDERCPVEQSEQFFTALRRRGTPAVLARFPGESHTFTAAGRPGHRIARLRLILDWLAAHG